MDDEQEQEEKKEVVHAQPKCKQSLEIIEEVEEPVQSILPANNRQVRGLAFLNRNASQFGAQSRFSLGQNDSVMQSEQNHSQNQS